MKHNGIELGPGSPLLTAAKAKRLLQPSEFDIQSSAMALLVGHSRAGQPRDPMGGMIPKHPELYLLYAIPNGTFTGSKRAAGRAKAEGVLSSMLDLHLPVMRGPFAGLYVEVKVPGKHMRPDQRDTADRLRRAHHCVVECQSVEEIVATVLGYLALAKGEPSIHGSPGDRVTERLRGFQYEREIQLTPRRERGSPATPRSSAREGTGKG